MRYLIFSLSFFVLSWAYAQTDTLNQTDANSKKQGYWIIYGKDRPGSGFSDTSIFEEGSYLNGRKTGIWKTYYPTGILKSEIEYFNNRPLGPFKIYYDNRQIEEEGNWKGTYYTGFFRRFESNGCLINEIDFGTDGKSKSRKYYDDKNCNVLIEFIDYTSKGMRYCFDTDGRIIDSSFVSFHTGCTFGNPELEFSVKTTGIYPIKKVDSTKLVVYSFDSIDSNYNITAFENKDGYHKLYNYKKQILYDGEFKKGKFKNGKIYIYNRRELLDKIEIYKNGKYAGDMQID